MNKHIKDPSARPAPPANALAIFTFGNLWDRPEGPDERARLLFCNHLVHFADLDTYSRRAHFIAAYSTGGSADARRLEAFYLAESQLLSAHEIADCVDWAEEAKEPWLAYGLKPEIV